MTADERAQLEARSDRHLRRGELAQALAGYQELVRAFPQDAAARRKLEQLQESLSPDELRSPKSPTAQPEPEPGAMPSENLESEGERRFAQGDTAGAIAAYRQALVLRPDNELLQERLAELFLMAQHTPGRASRPRPQPGPRAALYQDLLARIAARRRQ